MCKQSAPSLQTDNHTNTPLLGIFAGRMLLLMPNHQCQSIEGILIAQKYLTG